MKKESKFKAQADQKYLKETQVKKLAEAIGVPIE